MNAQLKSPYDPYVGEITSNPMYLSRANAEALLTAISTVHPDLVKNAKAVRSNMSPQEQLAIMVESLQDTVQSMRVAAMTGDGGPNAGDLKKVADAQTKNIQLISRIADTLKANERMQVLENSIIESLDETQNQTLKDNFLRIFGAKLAQISKKTLDLG